MLRERPAAAAVLALLVLAVAGCSHKAAPAPENEQAAVKMVERLGRSAQLESAPPHHVVEINLGNTGVTDADLKELKEVKRLRYLILNRNPITDAGVKELRLRIR